MLVPVPSDMTFGGMYVAPALVVGALGLLAAHLATRLLNATGLSRFFWHPLLAYLALWALASALIGLFLLRP